MNLLNQISPNSIFKICWISILTGSLSVNSFAESSNGNLKNHDRTNSNSIVIMQDSTESPVEYINTNFENASPLFWEYNPDGSVLIHFLYDHERSSPNRASNHWHFQVQAKSGSDVTLIIQYYDEIWNGRPAQSYSLVKNYYVSQDGVEWSLVPAEIYEKGHKIRIHMNSNSLFVAGMEPYRISDLDKLLKEIQGNPLVEIRPIGKTVEGRQIEIIRIGKPNALFRVFIRARAHPWEAGGNWVVQGLIRSLLNTNNDGVRYLDKYCVYILPMANKDGVARGFTRFNILGKDLNRGQNLPADPNLSPENYALEAWIKEMTAKGMKPNITMDLHNDRNGRLSFGRPDNVSREHYQSNAVIAGLDENSTFKAKNVNTEQYQSNTQRFEALMYKYTWYTWTERKIRKDASNSGNYGVSRYNVDISCTLELNQTWIDGLNKAPFGKDWELLGKQLLDVFYNYFDDKK